MSEEIDYEVEIAKNILLGHNCGNCYKCKSYFDEECEKPEKQKYYTCLEWKEDSFIGKVMFPIIRRAYPTLISNKIVSVQPMAAPSKNVFYIKPIYGNENKEGDLIMDSQDSIKSPPVKGKRKKKKDFVDKWSIIPDNIPKTTAKNIAIMLENQSKYLQNLDKDDDK